MKTMTNLLEAVSRRHFIKTSGGCALAAGISPVLGLAQSMATADLVKPPIKALVFDAYGTLFDVQAVISAVNQQFPGQGPALSAAWRTRQLEYTWLRSLMGTYEDFWQVTGDALVAACQALKLPLDTAAKDLLLDQYNHLDPFPEVKQALQALSHLPLAILSNGTPKMLHAAVASAGLQGVLPT